MLVTFPYLPTCFAIDSIETSKIISDAEYDVASAYVAVASAEDVGADVSIFLKKLNDAGEFLVKAYFAFKLGDFEYANQLGMQGSNTAKEIIDDATRLKMDAEIKFSNRLLITVTASGLGLSILFVLSLYGWRLLKKWYIKRVLGMKPEVGEIQ